MWLNREKSCEVELGQRSKRILYWRRKVFGGTGACVAQLFLPFCVFYLSPPSAIRFSEDKHFFPRFENSRSCWQNVVSNILQ